jgi:hypothetical protein
VIDIRARFAHVALGLAIGVAGGLLFYAINFPLPWFLGALTASLIAAAVNAPYAGPEVLSVPARIVLGVAVGTAFTPQILDQLPAMLGSLAIFVPWSVALVLLGPMALQKFAGLDRKTAFFAASPGGLTDVVFMAAECGAQVRTVMIFQATRILLIVLAIPLWMQFFGGFDVVGRSRDQRLWLVSMGVPDVAVLIVVGVLGYLAAKRLKLGAPAIVGPMILSAAVHAGGLTKAQVPFEALTLAQIVLGVTLGAYFRGLTGKEFRATLVAAIAFALGLLLASGLVTVLVAAATGLGSNSVLLAFAPGGQAELNLLAYILRLDVAYVAIHHLMRLAIVVVIVQWMFRRFMDEGR